MKRRQYVTKLTAIKALEFMDVYLVQHIGLMSKLEPTPFTVGKLEAFLEMRTALETAVKRARVDIKKYDNGEKVEFKRADISHVEALSHEL